MNKKILSLIMISCVLLLSACNSDTSESVGSEVNTAVSQQTSATEESVAVTDAATSSTTADIAETEESDIVSVWNPDISMRQEMKAEGSLCAVAYIGFVDAEMTAEECAEVLQNSRYAAEIPAVAEIPVENVIADCSGYELYLIIPADENATVSVNEWLLTEENEYAGEAGAVYYRSEVGAPVLIKCNVSDIMPNVSVSIVDNSGNTVQWCPSMSLKDGSVSRYGVEDKVRDITHYIYNETYECYIVEGDPQ